MQYLESVYKYVGAAWRGLLFTVCTVQWVNMTIYCRWTPSFLLLPFVPPPSTNKYVACKQQQQQQSRSDQQRKKKRKKKKERKKEKENNMRRLSVLHQRFYEHPFQTTILGHDSRICHEGIDVRLCNLCQTHLRLSFTRW